MLYYTKLRVWLRYPALHTGLCHCLLLSLEQECTDVGKKGQNGLWVASSNRENLCEFWQAIVAKRNSQFCRTSADPDARPHQLMALFSSFVHLCPLCNHSVTQLLFSLNYLSVLLRSECGPNVADLKLFSTFVVQNEQILNQNWKSLNSLTQATGHMDIHRGSRSSLQS